MCRWPKSSTSMRRVRESLRVLSGTMSRFPKCDATTFMLGSEYRGNPRVLSSGVQHDKSTSAPQDNGATTEDTADEAWGAITPGPGRSRPLTDLVHNKCDREILPKKASK